MSCSIGVQTVQYNSWEYRPENCDAVAAAAAASDCDADDVDDGQKLDALECRPHLLDKECRPSNSMIGSADRQMRRFGVRNSTTLRAARLIQWFGGQSVPEA